jgi:hypothetical protein
LEAFRDEAMAFPHSASMTRLTLSSRLEMSLRRADRGGRVMESTAPQSIGGFRESKVEREDYEADKVALARDE